MIFLIYYQRDTGTLLEITEFKPEDRQKAEDIRLESELSAIEISNFKIEILLLEADSLDDLKKTHQRYFSTVQQIAST